MLRRLNSPVAVGLWPTTHLFNCVSIGSPFLTAAASCALTVMIGRGYLGRWGVRGVRWRQRIDKRRVQVIDASYLKRHPSHFDLPL